MLFSVFLFWSLEVRQIPSELFNSGEPKQKIKGSIGNCNVKFFLSAKESHEAHWSCSSLRAIHWCETKEEVYGCNAKMAFFNCPPLPRQLAKFPALVLLAFRKHRRKNVFCAKDCILNSSPHISNQNPKYGKFTTQKTCRTKYGDALFCCSLPHCRKQNPQFQKSLQSAL